MSSTINIPEDNGFLSKSILDFIEITEFDPDINIKTLMILRNENIITQFSKYPYSLNDKQLMYSVTKAITALAIGIASDKGYFNLDDKVIDFFSDKLPEHISDNLRAMRIRHLLTMTSGLHDNTYSQLYPQKDWVRAFFAQEFPHSPGIYYRYSTHAGHVLSAIIQRATGVSMLEFLHEHLFSPLDIEKPQWEVGPDRIIAGGMGLSLYPKDLAKVGLMLLNKGVYQDKRIISESFVYQATTPQVFKHSEKNKKNNEYCGSHFGFQIHIGKNNYYRLDGAYGQTCLIAPDQDLVVVVTSAKSNKLKLIQYIYEYLIEKSNIVNSANNYRLLQDKIQNLKYTTLKFNNNYSDKPQFNKVTYLIDSNPNDFKKVVFTTNKEQLHLTIDNNVNDKYFIKFNFTKPVTGQGVFIKDIQNHLQKYISYARWITNNELELQVFYVETPYVVKYKFTFFEDKIKMEFDINCSFTLKSFAAFGMADIKPSTTK